MVTCASSAHTRDPAAQGSSQICSQQKASPTAGGSTPIILHCISLREQLAAVSVSATALLAVLLSHCCVPADANALLGGFLCWSSLLRQSNQHQNSCLQSIVDHQAVSCFSMHDGRSLQSLHLLQAILKRPIHLSCVYCHCLELQARQSSRG